MLEASLKELQRLFADQATRVEKMVRVSIESLIERNEEMAVEVIEELEPSCNKMEMVIEGKTAEIISLFAPKARDMRKIVAILKTNQCLERMGDQAVNIADFCLYLIPRRQVKPLIDIPRMSDITCSMVRDSFNAFLQEKIELANSVLERDNHVDNLEEQIIRELITYMMSDPSTIERAMRLIFITRNIERIADLATNVAEDVIYYITGRDIRHPGERPEEKGKK